jgi:hypothetical protein
MHGEFYLSLRNDIDGLSTPLWNIPAPSSYPPIRLDRLLENPLTFGWVHPQYNFLCLTPVGDRGTFFHCLPLRGLSRISPDKPDKLVRHSRSRGEFVLDEVTMHDWHELEESLSSWLLAVNRVLSLTEDGYEICPSKCGYASAHRTKEEAVAAVQRSLRCFLLLLGKATHSMLLVWRVMDWRKMLAEAGLRYSIIADMEVALNPDTLCVGGVLSMRFTATDIPSLFACVNAPIYVHWGPDPTVHTNFDQTLLPNAQLRKDLQMAVPCPPPPRPVQAIVLDDHRPWGENWSSNPSLDAPWSFEKSYQSPVTLSPQPEVQVEPLFKAELGTRQLNGQHWRDFFAAEDEKCRLRERDESPASQEKRQAKMASARTCPGKNRTNCKMYYWERNNNGHKIRTLVNKSQWSETWQLGMRRFNPHKNEFDINSEFDPSDCVNSPDATFDSDYEYNEDDHNFFQGDSKDIQEPVPRRSQGVPGFPTRGRKPRRPQARYTSSHC